MKKTNKVRIKSVRGNETHRRIFYDVCARYEQLRREQQYFIQKIF